MYAYIVDRGPHEDTFKAVEGSNWEKAYLKNLGTPY